MDAINPSPESSTVFKKQLPTGPSASSVLDEFRRSNGLPPFSAEEAAALPPWTEEEAQAFERSINGMFERSEE